MPQKERLRVFRGELKKTTGGLTKDQLIKNKRGKIVSRKKSHQAVGASNNLGSWLRSKGDRFKGKPKGFKDEEDRDDEKLGEVPVKKAKAVKKKAPPPKKASQKPQKKAEVAVKAAKPKAKKKKKLEPMMPGEKKELHKISVGNIFGAADKQKKHDAEMVKWRKELKDEGLTEKEIDKILGGGGFSLAAKVRKGLKASKRKGKRRTKRQLLQDVLDL